MSARRIHVRRREAVGSTRLPPLVFVHGGYASSACWDVHFLPWFSARGFDCHAPDLSGHGDSEGGERLDAFGLDDYVEDVGQVVDALDEAPVLIGHSMGSVVVERCLKVRRARAAVLTAPVPATGIFGATARTALTSPGFFSQHARALDGEVTPEAVETLRRVYYSPETSAEDVLRFATLFGVESRRALLDLTLLPMRFAWRLPALPVLVVGGEADALFPASGLDFIAARWGGEVAVIPRAGHTLMLDAHWRSAAERIAGWIEARR
ncbi:alpha/beta hydrolase [Accumulibacter sp.]|uniref:alpha/beta hydrolase n=1 Tax=Accumulibacter sp. TaxID=2053492 RepID=UPI0025FF43CD|nr:alpha/beta hydrolase [Accumulibacter sp.]MCM8594806.1 alpha/beta hydrolase [Accumulibacter sp.]MCM8625089.1 alpha/beta hydrolase [Accumulibacter sp.]MDS4048951.1 alpha/beta hydrolase [Accumulibacter sp.]